MRLTLRTMLAYLDDRLSPANAKEIGQKISKSPFASELTERIREVQRRRRLASTEKLPTNLDANLIAEYLDDQLTPELVATLEREVLANDASLAEVAATHEILGQLREAGAPEPRLRDRLYALDPSGRMEVVQSLAGGPSPLVPEAATTPTEWKPLESRTGVARRVPAVLLILMALLWIGLVITDPRLFSGLSATNAVAQGDAAANPVAAVDNPDNADADKSNASDAAPTPSEPTLVAGNDGQPAPETPGATAAPTDSITEPAAPGSGEPVTPVPGVGEPSNPTDTAVASNATESTEPPVSPAPGTVDPGTTQVTPPVPQEHSHRIWLRDEYQVAVLADPIRRTWELAGRAAVQELPLEQRFRFDWRNVFREKFVAVAAPYRVEVVADGTGWTSQLLGSSIVRVTNADVAGLDMLEGRVLVSYDRTSDLDEGAERIFVLSVGAQDTFLRLKSPDTRVGIEVTPVLLDAISLPDPPVDVPSSLLPLVADREVRLFVVSGAIDVGTVDSDAVSEVTRGQSLHWSVLSNGELTGVSIQEDPVRNPLPEWLYPASDEPVQELRAVMDQVSQAVTKAEDFRLAATNLCSDRNPQVGVAATNLLAATRSVDELLTVLLQATDEAVQRAAIDGLEIAASQTPEGYTRVVKSLGTRFPAAELGITMKLIMRPSDADARDPDFCSQLLQLLGSDRQATRELAFYRMQSFVGDRQGFHANADPNRRRDAVRRWERLLQQNGGRLLP